MSLADTCNAYENLDMKLNPDMLRTRPGSETNDFLYYEDGQLIGFLALFSFNASEAEISGMVHPGYRRHGVFTRLFRVAQQECKRRGIQDVVFIVEHTSQSGQAWVQSLGVQYHHSEYKMELAEITPPPKPLPDLQLRPAKLDETRTLARITALSFDMPIANVDWYTTNVMEHSDGRYYYVAALGNTVIGKLDVTLNPREAMIYGFGVLQKYRGRGYGRRLLAYAIQQVLATGQRPIVLEVVVENENALALYRSCGFRETTSYDYYVLLVI
jgi:ribosomal protein S18 acetylase RimI-like enzyme